MAGIGRLPKRIQAGDQTKAGLCDAASLGCVAADDDDGEGE
jgi:hypothetical protein